MDPVGLLHDVTYYASGFFDFLVAVGVIVLALTAVRKADATLGYVLAGGMGLRFLTVCCARAASSTVGAGADPSGPIPFVLAGLSLFTAVIGLAMWVVAAYVIYRLATKVAGA